MPTPGGFKAKPAPKPRPSGPKPPKRSGPPDAFALGAPRPKSPGSKLPAGMKPPKGAPHPPKGMPRKAGPPPAKMFPPFKPVGPLGPGSSDVDAGHISMKNPLPMVNVAKAKP